MGNERPSVRSRLVLVGVIACVAGLLAATSVVFARAGGPSHLVAQVARTAGYGAPGPGSVDGRIVGPSTVVAPRGTGAHRPGSGLLSNLSGAASPSTVTGSEKSTLPFTGLDLLLVAVIGAGLVGLGLRLRRSAGRIAASG